MIWTMPRPVLQWVASLLALGAAAAFVMGIVNAPDHSGRFPGERAGGRPALGATAINATEATPLSQDRIETAPKPAAKATNTDESDEADAADQVTPVTPPAKTADATRPPPTVVTPQTPPETTTPPPDDEPPH
jgi:outer membrane biosynthesis protein TonB